MRVSLEQIDVPAALRTAPWEAARKALLAAGPLSSALYVGATDVVAAARWEHYRRTRRMVSELFAVGSPARPVLHDLMTAYTALTVVCGAGGWASARRRRALRASGALLIAYGLSNVVAGRFPLDLQNEASVPGHIVATTVQLVLMLAAMGCAAAGFHGRLRAYCLASLAVSVAMGMVAFAAAPHGPHLLLGVGERISIGAFLLWVAVLALALWRAPDEAPRAGQGMMRSAR